MKKINIPDKTFNLYAEGIRTFIHLPRNDSNKFAENLKYGEKIILVNNDNGKELEQTFWFTYKYETIPRFYILAFKWDKKDVLFF